MIKPNQVILGKASCVMFTGRNFQQDFKLVTAHIVGQTRHHSRRAPEINIQ